MNFVLQFVVVDIHSNVEQIKPFKEIHAILAIGVVRSGQVPSFQLLIPDCGVGRVDDLWTGDTVTGEYPNNFCKWNRISFNSKISVL